MVIVLLHVFTSIVDKHTGNILPCEDVIQLDVWDLAGQFAMRMTQQIYYSDRCVYVLVFNIAMDLDETIDEEDITATSRKTVLGNYE